MDVLVNRLSELLEITVEKVIELYPVLKGQFITYQILSSVRSLFVWLSILSATFAILGSIGYLMCLDLDSTFGIESKMTEPVKKSLKPSVAIFLVSLLGHTLLKAMIYLLASDLMLMKEFL